jgi:CBS domain-containing protein
LPALPFQRPGGRVTVGEVMTTALLTVSPCDTIEDATDLLVGRGLSSAPVVDRSGQVVGMVSEVDLLQACLRRDPAHAEVVDDASTHLPALDVVVRDVMTSRLLTLDPTADVWDAARQLSEHGVKAAPVLVGRTVVGLVARRDLLPQLVHADDADQRPATTPGRGPSTLVGTATDRRG